MNMCRFGSRTDDGYEKLQAKLAQYIEEIKEVIREAAQKDLADEALRREGS
jgi:hypothetical protein